MGLFFKTPKPNPKLTVEGTEVAFNQDYGGWEFRYRGTDVSSFQPTLTLPSKLDLDSILDTLESLKPDMRTKLQKGLREWGEGSKLDDGESCSVDVQNFATDNSFIVSWSDGASWGDLGVDFTIKDQAIVDESWGD